MSYFSVVILAAGDSSRMGQPKQLLQFEGEPMVARVVNAAIASDPKEVVVVVGSHADEVIEAVEGLNCRTVLNENWQEGMGSSIRTGIAALEDPSIVVLLHCDQPKVGRGHIGCLAGQVRAGNVIAASSYDGTLGIPCAFSKAVLPKLLELKGEEGAKEIIMNERLKASIPLGAASLDIDTPQDLAKV